MLLFCQIRSLCFNKEFKEIAALSLNGYIHIFNAETFKQKLSRKLPNCQDNVSIAYHSDGLYAVGCRSYTILLDARTLQVIAVAIVGIILTIESAYISLPLDNKENHFTLQRLWHTRHNL